MRGESGWRFGPNERANRTRRGPTSANRWPTGHTATLTDEMPKENAAFFRRFDRSAKKQNSGKNASNSLDVFANRL